MIQPSVARRFARFVTGLDLTDVPPAAAARAVHLTLDIIGSCLGSSTMDFGRAVMLTAERLGGAPESSLVGGKAKVSAANAVLANGTLAHGLDFDDARADAIVHTGCVAVTTALAVGEAVGASGETALEAVLAGVEVMCRVGLAVPGKFHARNFHPTALCGSFAAAATAGKLYGLTENQLVHAFGICGSQASGIIQYLADGSWTKRLHPGWAAHAGVTAALLAQAGFTGPETVFEGTQGFYHAFAGDYDEARMGHLLESLSKEWEVDRLTFKPYPCGIIAHPYMDCALRLRLQHEIRPDQISEVHCLTAEGPVPRLWEPLEAKRRPPNGYAAKFSLPYLVAVMLAKARAGLAEFTDEAVQDRTVLDLAAKVHYDLDPTIDYPRQFAGHVRISLKDGRVVEDRQDRPRGGPDLPMTREELEAKFRGNAGLLMPVKRIDEVVQAVGGMAAARRLDPLMTLLRT